MNCLPPALCSLHTELSCKVLGTSHLLASVLLPTGGFRHIGPLTWTSFSSSIKRRLYPNNDKLSNATFQNEKFFPICPDTWFVKYIPQSPYKLDWNPCNPHLSMRTAGVLMFSWSMGRWVRVILLHGPAGTTASSQPLWKTTRERKGASQAWHSSGEMVLN